MKDLNVSKSKFMQVLSDIGQQIQKASDEYEARNELWWSSLSEAEREDAFYAVVRRIVKAEIEDKRSYRGALYDVFGFGEHMYIAGMDCGYMALHNSIVDVDEHYKLQRQNAKLKAAIQALLHDENGAEDLVIQALK
jgi:hypothetical protein